MKLLFCLLLFISAAFAEEETAVYISGQLHRDFNREIFTSTVEIFGTDKWGSTFFFTDFDFDSAGQVLSYFEVSRSLQLKRRNWGDINLSLQFNDGVSSFDEVAGKKTIPRTWLFGPAFSGIMWGRAQFELQALYRQEFSADPGWQLTAVWFAQVGHWPFEFLGNVDWNSNEYGDNPTSIQAEPQFQYRHGHIAFGTEIEISRNFQGAYTKDDGFKFRKWYAHPTLYVRYIL